MHFTIFRGKMKAYHRSYLVMGEHYLPASDSVIVLRVVSAANTSGFFLLFISQNHSMDCISHSVRVEPFPIVRGTFLSY